MSKRKAWNRLTPEEQTEFKKYVLDISPNKHREDGPRWHPQNRRDANHKEITKAFEKLGATVFDTSLLGGGFPDISVFYRGFTALVEIKTATGKLSPKQTEWFSRHSGMCYVVRNEEEVTEVIRQIDRIVDIINSVEPYIKT